MCESPNRWPLKCLNEISDGMSWIVYSQQIATLLNTLQKLVLNDCWGKDKKSTSSTSNSSNALSCFLILVKRLKAISYWLLESSNQVSSNLVSSNLLVQSFAITIIESNYIYQAVTIMSDRNELLINWVHKNLFSKSYGFCCFKIQEKGVPFFFICSCIWFSIEESSGPV